MHTVRHSKLKRVKYETNTSAECTELGFTTEPSSCEMFDEIRGRLFEILNVLFIWRLV